MSDPTPTLAPLDSPGLGTDTLIDERTSEFTDDGDHDRFAHYVRKEKVLESAMTGEPVIALCGKVWVPSRDPQRFPVCPMCKEIYESLRGPKNGDGDGSD